jgi:hypothetical protein
MKRQVRQLTLFELCAQVKQPRTTLTEETQETASDVRNTNPEDLHLTTSPDCLAVSVASGDSGPTVTAISSTSFESDIGLYVPLSSATICMPDHVRVLLLTKPWTPPDGYTFPGVQESGKTRKFQTQWLKRFPWLVYSPSKEGGFCKFCALFAPEAVRNQKLGRFISIPLNRYKDTIELCTAHEQLEYHKISMVDADEFLTRMKDPSADILHVIDGTRQKQIEDNRRRIIPVIKTVIFCGRQELPLRGHRDDGSLLADSPQHNDGVFRAALRFRLDAGDADLAAHLSSAGANATYLSWETQNEIINACGSIVARQIAAEVHSAKFFSILVDETTDCATKEQCSLSVRYVTNSEVRERFDAFCDLQGDMTAASITSAVVNKLTELKMDVSMIRGQGYDGAAAMSGRLNGVQAEIKKLSPAAPYIHCASHVLNLVTQKSSTVTAVRNAHGLVTEIAKFFNESAKRTTCLQSKISSTTSVKKLKNVCPTRWVEGHSAVIRFVELLGPVFDALEDLSTQPHQGGNTGSQATMLLRAISNSEFLVSLFAMEEMCGLLLPLSKSLQSSTADLLAGMRLVDNIVDVLQQRRQNAEAKFNAIFCKVTALSQDLDVQIQLPRRVGRQKNRENYEATDPEAYYRQAIYIPYMDNILTQLRERFEPHGRMCLRIQSLIPQFVDASTFDDLTEALDLYRSDLGPDSVIEGEFERWKLKWTAVAIADRPATAAETIQMCDSFFFPQIYILLQLFLTLPLTSATAERSFSTMRRLKSYLRSTMGESRLNGLAQMSINRDLPIDPEQVLDELAKKKRRLNFVL